MIVEARYVGGTGVLLGSGAQWVLLSDPADEQVLQELWEALTTIAPSGSPVVERVLAIVEKAFDGDPPALAVVDFTSGASTTLSRGSGHVRLAGAGRVLSLDGGSDSDSPATARRLVGGVVAADRVELMPLSGMVAPVVHARAAEAPPVTSGLIDGIPDNILAAKGPDGPPPRTRIRRRVDAAEDTGSLNDTSEPDPLFTTRIEEGTHTTIRPATPPVDDVPAAGVGDHDGDTTLRPAHLSHGTSSTVLAVQLSAGPPHPAGFAVVPGVPPARRAAGAPSRAASRARRPAPPDR